MAPYTKTSPSQKSTFDRCQRRWHYASIQRLPQPQSPYAAKGDEMHNEMEDYFAEGKEPKHPSCVAAKALIAPPRTEGVLVEGWTTTPPLLIADLVINGRIDYFDGRNPEFPLIKDYKSKGSPKGIQSAKKLATDPQLSIYGAWALVKFPEAKAVGVSHIYLGRDEANPFAKEVPVTLTADAIRSTVTAMVPGFEAMKVASQAATAEELPANHDACHDFGEICPFFTRCRKEATASLADLFGNEESEETMSIIATLKASPGASSIPDPRDFVGISTETPAPVQGESDDTGGDLLRKLRGM